MASTYLQRTQTAGNQKTFTISSWLKRSGNFANYNHLFTNSPNPGTWDSVRFDNDDQLAVRINNDSYVIKTNRKFRDASGWYHIVIAVDTTQGTSSNRVKIYVNGTQETSLASSSYPTQNLDTNFNKNSQIIRIGQNSWSSGNQTFDGSMSYAALVDGTQELPTIFGETDSVTGQWKIKTGITPSSGWGNNGFLILKNSNSVTDQSGQGNNFTVGSGTLTNTEDCPDNVFATMNSLANFAGQWALFENQNTYVRSAGSGEAFIASTLGIPATSGKFYTEVKYTAGGSESNIGLSSTSFPTSSTDFVGKALNSYSYSQNGEKRFNNNSSSYGNSYAPGDIIGIAVDATNSKLYFSKNGVFQNSGDPTSGATGTGAISISATPTEGFYYMACSKESGSTKNLYAWNFGNGFFQTSAVSSAGTAGSTPGIFEYDVPSGYEPLSTKGLNA